MRQIKTFFILRVLLALLCLPPFAAPVRAADLAGDFDYYVLSLSWSASWCAREGDARGAEQCDPRHDFGFTLHGLWPQHEYGYPEYCHSPESDPSRSQSAQMADIMGSGGLAWHQWKKHGRCSGLSASDYYDLSRSAYERIARPPTFRRLGREVIIDPKVVEEAFIEANRELEPEGVTVTCADGYVQEVRICLAKDLSPRACGEDVSRDCQRGAKMPPMR